MIGPAKRLPVRRTRATTAMDAVPAEIKSCFGNLGGFGDGRNGFDTIYPAALQESVDEVFVAPTHPAV